MRKLSIISIIISFCFYQCIQSPFLVNEQTMKDILMDLDLICGEGPFSDVREASNVIFQYCLNSNTANTEDIIEGDKIGFKVSLIKYVRNIENNCMDSIFVLSQNDTASINNRNTGDGILEFQDCINLIKNEYQMIHCLYNKGYISDVNGIDNAFTLVILEDIHKIQ